MKDKLRQDIIDGLRATGLSEQEAHAYVATYLFNLETVQVGVSVQGQRPEDLGKLWERARASGATRLVLDIMLEDEGQLNVQVIGRDGEILGNRELN